MASLLFFKNVRNDGGTRMGIETKRDRLFHQFIDGPGIRDAGEEDPTLHWYVDIGFQGKTVPADPDLVKKWLVKIGPHVRQTLQDLADRAEAGVDELSYPFSIEKQTPEGVRLVVKGSANRHIRDAQFAGHLLQLAKDWDKTVRQLPKFKSLTTW